MLLDLHTSIGFQRGKQFWTYVPQLLSLSALIPASFWVGMITNYQLGLRVLGIGIGAFFAFWLSVAIIVVIRQIKKRFD